jgi:dihydroorotase-like cyclic amidohydrolase
VNGVGEPKSGYYVFIYAIIMQETSKKIENGIMHIRNGRIIAVGNNIVIPTDAIRIDCKGKYIYPSFIDAYSDYGIPIPTRPSGPFNFFGPAQLASNVKGAFG